MVLLGHAVRAPPWLQLEPADKAPPPYIKSSERRLKGRKTSRGDNVASRACSSYRNETSRASIVSELRAQIGEQAASYDHTNDTVGER
jgi:hypothetical protein